jgi:lipopolysaccharide/colanic/teichoic acid biosynthesis glycosyltransferase
VLLLIIALIRLDPCGPATLAQGRMGRGGKVFEMFTFTAVHQDVDPFEAGLRGPTDLRVARVGHFLRRTSLPWWTDCPAHLGGR